MSSTNQSLVILKHIYEKYGCLFCGNKDFYTKTSSKLIPRLINNFCECGAHISLINNYLVCYRNKWTVQKKISFYQ